MSGHPVCDQLVAEFGHALAREKGLQTHLPVDSGLLRDPARLQWNEVRKVEHYYLDVDALSRPMRLREDNARYGETQP